MADETTSHEDQGIDLTESCRIILDPKTGEIAISCPPDYVQNIVKQAHEAGRVAGRQDAGRESASA